jgi:hypothetical protein
VIRWGAELDVEPDAVDHLLSAAGGQSGRKIEKNVASALMAIGHDLLQDNDGGLEGKKIVIKVDPDPSDPRQMGLCGVAEELVVAMEERDDLSDCDSDLDSGERWAKGEGRRGGSPSDDTILRTDAGTMHIMSKSTTPSQHEPHEPRMMSNISCGHVIIPAPRRTVGELTRRYPRGVDVQVLVQIQRLSLLSL